jgi:hypothetical protein
MDILIYEAAKSSAKYWKKHILTWSDFVKKLRAPAVGNCNRTEYKAMTDAQRHAEKDMGAFIAADLIGGSRAAKNVRMRTLITLDIDESKPLRHRTCCPLNP